MSNLPNAPMVWGAKMFSIWRDIILTTEGTSFANLNTVDFEVFADLGPGDSHLKIMSGRASRRPGDTYVAVRVNDIIAGYVQSTMDFKSIKFNGDYGDNEHGGRYGECIDKENPNQVTSNGGVLRIGNTAPSLALKFGITWTEPGTTGPGETEYFVVLDNHDYKNTSADYMLDPGPYNEWELNILNDHVSTLIDDRQILFLSVAGASAPVLKGLNPVGYVPTPVWWIRGFDGDYGHGNDFDGVNADVGSVPHHFFLNPCQLVNNDPDGGDRSGRYYFDVYCKPEGVDFRMARTYPDFDHVNYGRRDYYVDDKDQYGYGLQRTFKVCRTAAKYVLYYVNARGGIDSLVTSGLYRRGGSVSRTQIVRAPFLSSMDRTRNPRRERGKDVISAVTTETLELHTEWLNNYEASRIHNLLNSPAVWVHDVEASWSQDVVDIEMAARAIYPAVLTDSSYVTKTYKNQGNKLVSYTINLELATDIIRR